ncbi:MAG: ABC transporter ATP-binding protein [Candidatus Bathyarchaeota archaeon]|nr:ABC transporter ATP-binding protein [Candidatus Bathyarchaeota archaeon]
MKTAVEATEVTKFFGNIKALDGLNLKVNTGEIFGLIGPNGAGKTTCLRVISTLLLPTSGTVKVFGLDVSADAPEVRKIITYLPEEAGAYRNLSGWEYLQFMANFSARNKDEKYVAVQEAAEICGLGDRLRDKVKTYSKGMKRRLLIARALMPKPRLAILDEPTGGLDVLHSYHIRGIIKRYAKNRDTTVLLSSHNMLEVEHLCDKVALVNKGKVVAEGKPAELRDKYGSVNLEDVFAKVVGLA